MTAFHGQTTKPHENSSEQIKELRHAIQENTRKLKKVQQQRLSAKEEIIRCTREAKRRLDLIIAKSGVVDVLQQLGNLLQEECYLSEQLNGQDSADRNDLQERSEHVTNKVRRLAAEITEMKQCLAEAKARHTSAQALIHAESGKSKRAQSKRK